MINPYQTGELPRIALVNGVYKVVNNKSWWSASPTLWWLADAFCVQRNFQEGRYK